MGKRENRGTGGTKRNRGIGEQGKKENRVGAFNRLLNREQGNKGNQRNRGTGGTGE